MNDFLNNSRRRGFLFLEAVVGLCLLATLGAIFALARGQQAQAAQLNAAQLEVEQIAQQALLAAQQQVAMSTDEADSVCVETLPRGADGMDWLVVTAHHAGRSTRLIGPALRGGKP